MRMHDFAARYAVDHDLEPASVAQHRFAIASLQRFAVKPLDLGDFSDDLLNGWLGALLAKGLTRTTVRSYRTRMLTLWRAAAEQNLCEPPGQIRKVKRQRPLVTAWTRQECRLLLLACDFLDGRFPNGAPRCAVMKALVLIGWRTALRPGDWLALRLDCLRPEGLLTRQSKTGEPIFCPLDPDEVAAVQACVRPGDGRIFPITDTVLRKWFRKLLRMAGLRGSPKWLRRSSATAVEMLQPGAAARHLGHKTPGLAEERYLDMRLLLEARNRPIPPRLEPPSSV